MRDEMEQRASRYSEWPLALFSLWRFFRVSRAAHSLTGVAGAHRRLALFSGGASTLIGTCLERRAGITEAPFALGCPSPFHFDSEIACAFYLLSGGSRSG